MKATLKSLIFCFTLGLPLTSTYAEVQINDDRNFVVDDSTVLTIDGIQVDGEEFELEAEGMVALVAVGDDANASVTSGTANQIDAVNQIKGPVTQVDPLQVLGQDVINTSTTVFDDTTGDFSLGELLEVSGNFNQNSVLLATRIESKTSLDVWKLMAHVSAVNATDINFGNLTVSILGLTTSNCGNGPVAGDLVELKATPVAGFDIANTLDSLTQFECKNGLVDLPDNPETETIGFEIEGFVTAIPDATHFEINSQLIEIMVNVEYENGSAEDLVIGVKVEAEGTLNTTTGLFITSKISFRETRIRIEASVAIADFSSEQIILMGIVGQFSALTDDKDGLIVAGLSVDTQIEARGFVDSTGNFLIDEFRERGVADPTDTRLRGPVSQISTDSFMILGVTIDTTAAVFFDNAGASISSLEFFAQLVDGSQVDSHHGSYDLQSNTLTGGELTLEFGSSTSSQKTQAIVENKFGGGIGGIGLGSITAFNKATGTIPPITPPPVPQSSGGGSLGIMMLMLAMLSMLASRRKLAKLK